MSLADFRGETLGHQRWRGRDFSGQRVAVIASARETVDIVPELVRTALFVKVFQDRPGWVLPRPVPALGPLRQVAARLHLRLGVSDDWTRRLLTPHPRFGSPHFMVSEDFYAALERPDCKLIAWPIYAITPDGVRTAEGIEHRVDCIVHGETVPLGHDTAVTTKPARQERTA
ncbi:FAD-dependent oxidoreductase [Amycolatopsis sp. H20-H5]|uniref:FAD-dependent oxidoreductase n=1 Tax=Amycolatopsis sp. H20-H5 TaxID=3046309 RepID=UPI002DB9E1A8|nr:FAD-dependent oxidoreductase [Amycolatopsis sp. H20-H5]MEC3977441.1 FAD-dependent oxidoreductase [Amycolatopsis sp. H20-H5]